MIPSGDFISVDEILMEIDDVSADEINSILLKLEMKNCIFENDGSYGRK